MKVKIGNIRGPQGPEGPEGPEGKQGPTGATGATGQVDASTPISFEENSSYVNIESGESIATIFGKCKKILGGILTGAGSTLLGADLTAGKVLLSNSSGKITASNITDTELGYLDGLTSNVQTSLNSLTEKKTLAKSDLFDEYSNIQDFYAVKVGSIIIVQRCVFANKSYTPSTVIAKLKSNYKPLKSIRIPVQLAEIEDVTLSYIFINENCEVVSSNTFTSNVFCCQFILVFQNS